MFKLPNPFLELIYFHYATFTLYTPLSLFLPFEKIWYAEKFLLVPSKNNPRDLAVVEMAGSISLFWSKFLDKVGCFGWTILNFWQVASDIEAADETSDNLIFILIIKSIFTFFFLGKNYFLYFAFCFFLDYCYY